jgi:hypothetical protein
MSEVHQAVIVDFTGKVPSYWLARGSWLSEVLKAATVPGLRHEVAFENGNEALVREFQKIAEVGVFAPLQAGDRFVAFGSPQHVGAEYEWIPIHAFQFLKKHPRYENVLVGGGITYWNVHIVEPSRWQTHPGPTIDAVADVPKTSIETCRAFVREYVARRRRQGLPPTKSGLESDWRAAGHRGFRGQLKNEYDKILGQAAARRGRPIIRKN